MSEGESKALSASTGAESQKEDDLQVVRTTKIEKLTRDKTDGQVSPEADEVFIEKLNVLADVIASEAVKISERRDGNTVEKREIEDAYQNLMKPHNQLFQVLSHVEDARDKIEATAKSSPLSQENLND